MAARSRDSLDPTPCSASSELTYTRFITLFPDHDACLDYLKDRFHPDGSDCPKCGKQTKFHRIRSRAAYSCQWCGHQVYPTAGTIFHKSTTNLQMWFWAIFLMSSTRCGISAKQLEREIGVSYPTAHRMFKQIRTLLSQDGAPLLSGDVEVDETAGGGRVRASDRARGKDHVRRKVSLRPTIWGAVERGGEVRAKVVKSRGTKDVEGAIYTHVLPASMIFTDEWLGYNPDRLGRRDRGHKRIRHEDRVYVDGNVHTNTIEGFFGLFKNGVRGVYHSVSSTYLQSYLDEYCFRYNARNSPTPLFDLILGRVQKEGLVAA
jgi:transposase-like protein